MIVKWCFHWPQAFPGSQYECRGIPFSFKCFTLNPGYGEVNSEPFIEILNPLQLCLWRKSAVSLQECICKGSHYLEVTVTVKSCPLYFFIRIIIVLVVSQGALELKYEALSPYIQDNTDTRGCGGCVCLTYCLVRAQRAKNCHLCSQSSVLYVVTICMCSQ